MIRLDLLADAGGVPRSTLHQWRREGHVAGTSRGRGRGKTTLLTEDEAFVAARAMVLRREGRLRFLGRGADFQMVGRPNSDLRSALNGLGLSVLVGSRIVSIENPLPSRLEAEVKRVVREAIHASKEAA